MTPKIWLFVVLIAVLAPVYLLLGVATSKNVKEMSEKTRKSMRKNRAKHKYLILGQFLVNHLLKVHLKPVF